MNPSWSEETLNQDLEVALKAVDTVLAWESHGAETGKVSEQFSRAIGAMVRLRNCLADARRERAHVPAAVSLDKINALISMMASIEYPLGGIHWPRVHQVRDGLTQMLSP